MRICVVVGEFPALSHTFVLNQVRGLTALGHEVSVVCDRIGTDPRIDFEEDILHSVMRRTHRWWPVPGQLRDALDHLPGGFKDKISTAADMAMNRHINDCDVLLAHFGGNGLRLARVKKRGRLKPPIVTVFHGNDVGVHDHGGTMHVYAPLFRHGALHLTVNGVFADMLIEHGAKRDDVKVHRMGIDCDDFAYRWRPLQNGPLQCVSVCRLVEKKGIEYALRAFARLLAERPDIDFNYAIIGDGPLKGSLEKLTLELGLQDRVEFLGARPHDEVKSLLGQAHILMLPSITAADGDVEGVPVAIMEAMAAGLIVVSSRHSGIPELVTDRKSGFLSDEKDVAGLASDIAHIADHHGDCQSVAIAARAKVEAEFDNARLNADLASLLSDVAQNGTERTKAT